MKPEESLHIACQRWLDMMALQDWRFGCVFHVPNGGQRHIAVARKLKAMGVKPGIPDYVCPVPSNGFNGMVVELKVPGGRLSEHQKRWMEIFKRLHYRCAVCYEVEPFKHGFLEYFNEPPSAG